MDEMEKLVEQVKILAATVETMISRQDQLLKMLAEQSQALHQGVDDLRLERAELQQAREEELTAADALKEAVDDVDAQVDDLAKVTAALVMIQKQQQTPGSEEQ